MIASAGAPPARKIVCRKISGSGFFTPNVSWPQIAAKCCVSFSVVSNNRDSHSSLLVHTAKR